MNGNRWARLLAYVTGLVNQELLLQNEYLAAENRILRAHLPARLPLSDAERYTLAEIAKRLGRKALEKGGLAWPNQTPFSPGTSGSPLASSMVPPAVPILAGLGFQPKWRNWWFVLPARTLAGVTTASPALWLTSVIRFSTTKVPCAL
jgi:hypothetical protein